MKILNVSPLELIFLLVIVIIFLGPNQIVTLANRLGKLIRTVTHSEFWINVTRTADDLRRLPKEIAQESGLQESLDEINQTTQSVKQDLNTTQKELHSSKQELRKRTGEEIPSSPDSAAEEPKEPPTLMKK